MLESHAPVVVRAAFTALVSLCLGVVQAQQARPVPNLAPRITSTFPVGVELRVGDTLEFDVTVATTTSWPKSPATACAICSSARTPRVPSSCTGAAPPSTEARRSTRD